MRIARTRPLAVLLLGLLLTSAGVVVAAPPAFAAYDPASPPYAFDPVNDLDTLTVYDAATGAAVTSGSTSDPLKSYYFVSSRDWSPDHTKAQLYGYLAEDGKAQGAWSGQTLGPGTTYPATTAPAPVSSAGTRPVARGDSVLTFGKLAASFPNGAASASSYYQLYQVRVRTTFPAPLSQSWASADVAIDPAAGTWRLLRPGARSGIATTAGLSLSPVSPAPSGSTQSLTVAVTPPEAQGTVQFLSGKAKLGSPVAVASGSATLSTVLPVGSYSLSAQFTPTDPTAFQPSLSNSVGYQVNADADVPDAPQLLSADPADSAAVLTFSARGDGGSAITGYQLSVTSASGPTVRTTVPNDATLTRLDGGNLQATLPGLTNGRTYSATIAAINSVGTGAMSDPPLTVMPSAPSVPGAPTAVTAGAGDGSASVSFTAPADGGSPITSYRVSATPAGGATVVATLSAISGAVAGLVNGTTYSITVQATNALGTGPASTPAVNVTPRALTPPGPPTEVVTSAQDGAIGVAWQPPLTDGNSAVTGYRVVLTTAGADPVIRELAGTSALFTGLTNGSAYGVSVLALNAVGAGAGSALATLTPATRPSAPVGVLAVPTTAGAVVHWSAPASDGGSPVTTYLVTATPVTVGDPVTTQVADVLTASLKGLAVGTTYTVRVVASNLLGVGPVSESATVTPFTTPGSPGRPLAQASDHAALVTFAGASANGSPVTRYTVRVTPGGRTVTTTRSPVLVTGLTNGTAYSFTVVATNAAGQGPQSLPSASVRPRPSAVTSVLLHVPKVVVVNRPFVIDATILGAPTAARVVLQTTRGTVTSQRVYALTAGRLRLSLVTTGSSVYRLVYSGDLSHRASSAAVRVTPLPLITVASVSSQGTAVTVTGRVLPASSGRPLQLLNAVGGDLLGRGVTDATGGFVLQGVLPRGTSAFLVRAGASAQDPFGPAGTSVVLRRSVV